MGGRVCSMTGFGASTFEMGGARWRVEVRSVNHRHLNTRFHVPPELASLEAVAVEVLRERLGRGSVEVRVHQEEAGERAVQIKVDHKAADALMAKLHELSREIGASPPTLELVLKLGDFVHVQPAPVPEQELERAYAEGLRRALDELDAMREREGAALAADLLARLDVLDGLLAEVERRAPEVRDAYEERLRGRLEDARRKHGVDLDDARLATELLLFADKSDVTEETVRARTHVAGFREGLTAEDGELVGKRLDFLAQELGREFNTIGSKCRDAGMAIAVVDAKVELERIREQVQNLA